jgi:hypothetical protein
MVRFSKRSVFPLMLKALCALALLGCRDTRVANLPHDKAVNALLCQASQHLAIGFYAGKNLVVLNPCNLDINHSIKFDAAPNTASVYNYVAAESPDHNWLAKKEADGLIFRNTSQSGPAVNIQTTRLLSNPLWSPDSAFFFFWAAEDRYRSRAISECLDDVSDLYVFNAKSRTGTLAGRVCSGVPIDAFRWLSY